VRSDTARTKVAAMGMPATSAMVATQAIQDASSAETEKAPPMSAMARSTSCEEMLEPTMAMVMTAMVWIATDSGGGLAGGANGAPVDLGGAPPPDPDDAISCVTDYTAYVADRQARHAT
jgi:hypothetical protein